MPWRGRSAFPARSTAYRWASFNRIVRQRLQSSIPFGESYVEEFGGNTGLLLREHVIGDLANSARFVPVEEPGNADAFIRGRSDSQQQGTKVSNSGTESGSSRSGVSAVAIAGSVFGSVRTRGQAASSSTSVSENVISETISLRLTVPSGDVIWGWDETKPCVSNLVGPEFSMIAKARCAVQDLTGLANQ
jgi:hypothetical protein